MQLLQYLQYIADVPASVTSISTENFEISKNIIAYNKNAR